MGLAVSALAHGRSSTAVGWWSCRFAKLLGLSVHASHDVNNCAHMSLPKGIAPMDLGHCCDSDLITQGGGGGGFTFSS